MAWRKQQKTPFSLEDVGIRLAAIEAAAQLGEREIVEVELGKLENELYRAWKPSIPWFNGAVSQADKLFSRFLREHVIEAIMASRRVDLKHTLEAIRTARSLLIPDCARMARRVPR